MNDEMPLQATAEFKRAFAAQAHEIADAATAAVTNAQAGLNWLQAEQPNLEEVRKAFDSIINNGWRAGKMAVRLRALVNEMPTKDGSRRSLSEGV
jgi:hypothetical protein